MGRIFFAVMALVTTACISPAPAARLNGIVRWGMVLQEIQLNLLAKSEFQLVVIDYSLDGSDSAAFKREEIEALKKTGKKVLCYLSVGEAEDYRFYWKQGWREGNPAWLGPENPDWAGNFKVKFWDSDWQKIIIHNPGAHPHIGNMPSYLDRIIDAGFDGVYLDIIDGWWYWSTENSDQPQPIRDAAEQMIRFVLGLANHARSRNPAFLIVPQNGFDLVRTDRLVPAAPQMVTAYLAAISAIAAEDVYPEVTRDTELGRYLRESLRPYQGAGIPILNIEYPSAAKAAEYVQKARSMGLIPFATNKALTGVDRTVQE